MAAVPSLRRQDEILSLTAWKNSDDSKFGLTISSHQVMGDPHVRSICRLIQEGSPAELAGLQVGDEFRRIGSFRIHSATQATELLGSLPAGSVEIEVLRTYNDLRPVYEPMELVRLAKASADAQLHLEFGAPVAGRVGLPIVGVRSFAAASVLTLGDRLEMINGEQIKSGLHAEKLFAEAPVGDVDLTLARPSLQSPPVSPDEEMAM